MRLSPNLRFPRFEGEWEEKKLKELGTFFSGGTPKTTNKNYYAGNISFIRSGEINSDVTELKISENGLNNSSAKMVNKGEILIALYGATSGEIAISKISGAINQAILCFQTKENKQFFKNLWEKHLNNILVTYLQGGQGNLSAEIIKRLKFYFPSSKEQVKISIFLEKIEERIELSNKIIAHTETLIKNLNNSLKETYGNDIEVNLNDLGCFYSGLSGKNADDFGDGKPFITYLNVFNNNIVSDEEFSYVKIDKNEKQNAVKYGDALFTISSETPEEVGISAVYLGDEKELYLNSFCLGYRLNNFKTLLPEYLPYLFSSQSFRKFIFPFAQGSTRYNLSRGDLMKRKFCIPNIENQKKIASLLSNLSKKLTIEKNLLLSYKQQKSFLLQNLFI